MMMSPKVKLIVEQECKKYMVSVSDVAVKKRRSYPAINARRSIIARLYNPETSGPTKKNLSRQLGINRRRACVEY
jgi:hypothetical protein